MLAQNVGMVFDKQCERARALFEAGLAAADPAPAVAAALSAHPIAPDDPDTGKLWLIALGKAAVPMARAAMPMLGALAGAIVVTNPENAAEVAGAEVFAAAHPVPDAVGLKASEAVWEMLGQAGAGDRVLVLVSGGGSALLPAPVEGVTLADKMALNAALLASGAEITEMNLIRQQLSRLKGGGLVARAAPAVVTGLILSDVVGDDLRVVASGPTVSPIGTAAEAIGALRARGLWEDLSAAIRGHLEGAAGQGVSGSEAQAENHLIGSNGQSLAAMAALAAEALVAEVPLEGDVRDAARVILAAGDGPGTWLWGGETTVVLRGSGRGGRNQHLALSVAVLAEAAGWEGDWVFLSGGTDGRDGPTDAAGGIVGPGTLAAIRAAGIDPVAALEDNDSYTALKAADALLMTGGTGTNVADLQVLMRG